MLIPSLRKRSIYRYISFDGISLRISRIAGMLQVYPDWVIINGCPAESDIGARVLLFLCCTNLSCEGGLILVGPTPRFEEFPHGPFVYDEKLAANNVCEAATTFELEIDQFVGEFLRLL